MRAVQNPSYKRITGPRERETAFAYYQHPQPGTKTSCSRSYTRLLFSRNKIFGSVVCYRGYFTLNSTKCQKNEKYVKKKFQH